MKDKTAVIILVIIAIVSIIGLVLIFETPKQGAITYQQLIHRDYAVYSDYNVCYAAPCGRLAAHVSDVEIGDGSVNALCMCPDGNTYQISYRRNY